MIRKASATAIAAPGDWTSATSSGGMAPSQGPTYGITSVTAAKAPNASA
jgi:hypothetical protein